MIESTTDRASEPLAQPLSTRPTAPASAGAAVMPVPADDALVERELLVEDVSIDGMCGVY